MGTQLEMFGAAPAPSPPARPACRGRQSVQHVLHPQRGPGLVIWRNGPAVFEGEDGARVELFRADSGGSSSGPPRRSWMVLEDPEHGRVEADEAGPGSDRHQPAEHPLIGRGWLVWGEGAELRFENDAGDVLWKDRWFRVSVGTAAYVAARDAHESSRKRGEFREPTTEESRWLTFQTRNSGTVPFLRVRAHADGGDGG